MTRAVCCRHPPPGPASMVHTMCGHMYTRSELLLYVAFLVRRASMNIWQQVQFEDRPDPCAPCTLGRQESCKFDGPSQQASRRRTPGNKLGHWLHSTCNAHVGVLTRAESSMFLFSCCRPAMPSGRVEAAEVDTKDKDMQRAPSTTQKFDLIRAHSRVESRILHTVDSNVGRSTAPSRSLLEASARRLATQDGADGAGLDTDDHGIPQKFMTAYFSAIKEANPRCVVFWVDVRLRRRRSHEGRGLWVGSLRAWTTLEEPGHISSARIRCVNVVEYWCFHVTLMQMGC